MSVILHSNAVFINVSLVNLKHSYTYILHIATYMSIVYTLYIHSRTVTPFIYTMIANIGEGIWALSITECFRT